MAETKTKKKSESYYEGIGRRKEALARVRLTPASKTSFVVNDRALDDYFPVGELRKAAEDALLLTGMRNRFAVSVRTKGGGKRAQAEAIRLGVARALILSDKELRPSLKQAGFLTRDSREVERKKFGLRKARRAPQWAKR